MLGLWTLPHHRCHQPVLLGIAVLSCDLLQIESAPPPAAVLLLGLTRSYISATM